MSWKDEAHRDRAGFYRLRVDETDVRLFMTETLLRELEDDIGPQIANTLRDHAGGRRSAHA